MYKRVQRPIPSPLEGRGEKQDALQPTFWWVFRLVAFMLLVSPSTTLAHESRPAYLELTEHIPGHYDVVWRRPASGEQVLALAPRFSNDCQDSTPHTADKIPGAVVERWMITCREPGLVGHTITIDGLSRTITDVLVRISLAAGVSETHLLRSSAPSLVVRGMPTWANVAGDYFRLGIEHIWSGIDHLLFITALLLLVPNHWTLLKTITAFTVAHSITLALATLGVVHVPQAPVEAVIALSILVLAVELAKDHLPSPSLTTQYPWLVAFTFGLLHGFGFAGALAEVGLPPIDIPLALLMFNLGVEAGQIAFIIAVLVTMATVRRWGVMQHLAWRQTTVYAIGSLSAFWLIQRIVAFF